jgi:hypothetical protein
MIRRRRRSSHDGRIKGHSYPQTWYEDAVGALLTQIGHVDDATISEVVRLHSAHRPRADELSIARIRRAREDAARQLGKTRDLTAWQATIGRLDAEERIAMEPMESRRLTPLEIVDYTRSLPRLWADSGPDGRQALVVAIFARLDVLGFQRLEFELTPDAINLGLDAALPPILELRSQIGEFGRGERRQAILGTSTSRLPCPWRSRLRGGALVTTRRRVTLAATPRPARPWGFVHVAWGAIAVKNWANAGP